MPLMLDRLKNYKLNRNEISTIFDPICDNMYRMPQISHKESALVKIREKRTKKVK